MQASAPCWDDLACLPGMGERGARGARASWIALTREEKVAAAGSRDARRPDPTSVELQQRLAARPLHRTQSKAKNRGGIQIGTTG